MSKKSFNRAATAGSCRNLCFHRSSSLRGLKKEISQDYRELNKSFAFGILGEPRIASMPSCDLFPLRNFVAETEFVLILFNNRTRWRFLAFYLQFARFSSQTLNFISHICLAVHDSGDSCRRLTLFATGVMFDKITTRSGSNEELLIKFLAPNEAHCETKWHSAAL